MREEVEERHKDNGVNPSKPMKLETVPEGREEGFAPAACLSARLSLSFSTQEDLRFGQK